MLRISELLAPCYIDPGDVHIEGDNWSLLIGSVDLNKEIVTIQRNNYLFGSNAELREWKAGGGCIPFP